MTDSVLLPGATVEAGAVVERSLVMGSVGANAVVRDAMVGADGSVAAGDTLIAATSPPTDS